MHKKSRRRLRRAPRVRRASQPGAVPGTVKPAADAHHSVVRLITYGPEQYQEQLVADLGSLRDRVGNAPVTWINVEGVGDAATIEQLGEVFDLHPLALEDVVNVHQRAKVEDYLQHLFIVARAASHKENLESEQISLFLGRGFVLTFQERSDDSLEPVRERLRQGRGRIRVTGADYLAYSLLDAIIDGYFPIIDDSGDRLEALDQKIGQPHSARAMEELHVLRGDLMVLRRGIRPLRDALVKLMPDPTSLITEETQFHLRDCYDHTIQLIDLLDTYRDMCADLRDFYVSANSARMNEVVKVLTIISTIFIPLSFIASVYGMNFNTAMPGNMPELNWPYGYVLTLAVMGAVGAGLLAFIWRKGWLARGDV
jgi:magnesium transporter